MPQLGYLFLCLRTLFPWQEGSLESRLSTQRRQSNANENFVTLKFYLAQHLPSNKTNFLRKRSIYDLREYTCACKRARAHAPGEELRGREGGWE